jgi:hypothetical protein
LRPTAAAVQWRYPDSTGQGISANDLRVQQERQMTAMRSERYETTGGEHNGVTPLERRTPENLSEVDSVVTAFEGEIREFVRRDISIARRAQAEAEQNADPLPENLNALIRRISSASMEEIDRVILELQAVREMLRNEGDRVAREIAGYASLSHAAMTAMKVIGDSLTQWKSAPTNQHAAE